MINLLNKITVLNQTTLDSINETNEKQIIGNFTETGLKVLKADFGLAWFKVQGRNKFEIAYKTKNFPYNPLPPRQKGINYYVQKTKISFFAIRTTKQWRKKYDVYSYMKSYAIIPVLYQQSRYGNIVLCFRKKHKFTKEEQSLCAALGNVAAQAITIFRLYKHKDEFLGVASHELRTPLTTIKGFAQLLQKHIPQQNSNLNYFLSKINSQVDKLGRLVEELLDVSKIEAGKLKFERQKIHPNEFIKEIVEDLQFTTDQHKIILNGKIHGSIFGNPDRLQQVFTNILVNAIKYSPNAKEIMVRLRQKGPQAIIAVQDFGVGIARKHYGRVFDRFFQGKAPGGGSFPGLGLGLFISREIVRQHKGDIWFESKKGKGTTFYIKLPRKSHKNV